MTPSDFDDSASELFSGEEALNETSIPVRMPEHDSSTCLAWESFDQSQGGRHYFIKQLRPELQDNKSLSDSFVKEFHLGQKISSEYFPNYISLDETDDSLSLTMDFIDGETLEERLRRTPAYFRNKYNLLRFIFQMLEALSVLHKKGVLHLDLKPANLMLTHRTDNLRIIDLGYGYSSEWSSTMGMSQGFASPEQLRGDMDAVCMASDIYSFGRIVQYIARKSGSRLPRGLRSIIARCVKENLADRYDNVEQIMEDVDAYRNAPKRKIALYCALSACLTLAVILSAVSAYRFWYATEFTVDGIHYHVCDAEKFDVTADGLDGAVLEDSCLCVPEYVTYHGRTYSVNLISEEAFRDCHAMRSVQFPSELHEIGNNAFLGCSELRAIHIPKRLNYVYGGAFAHCPSLTSIQVEQGNAILYSIDNVLFAREGFFLIQCPASRKGRYTIPEGIQQIYNQAFDGCSSLTQIDIPDGVYRIHSNAFQDCSSLRSITLPEGLCEVSNSCFQNCSSLRSVTIQEGPTSIGYFAFEGCRSLREVHIPSTVIRIDNCAFNQCTSLEHVTNLSLVPQEISDEVFVHYGTLHVPAQSVEAYRAAPNWNRFHIVPLE